MDNVIEKLEEMAVRDWQKPGFSKIQRANIITDYMNRKAITLTEMAKQLNIPKTTLFGWLCFNKITEKEYNKLKKDGKSNTDIFNILKTSEAKETVHKGDTWEYHLSQIEKHTEKLESELPTNVTPSTKHRLVNLSNKFSHMVSAIIVKKK